MPTDKRSLFEHHGQAASGIASIRETGELHEKNSSDGGVWWNAVRCSRPMMAMMRKAQTIVLATAGVLFVASYAYAGMSAPRTPPLDDCDRLAADPYDPAHVATGVLFADIIESFAIPACEDAVIAYPDTARFNLQLGRAYEKAKKYEKAVEQFKISASLGDSSAVADVGLMYLKGIGVEQNSETAIIWFRKSIEQETSLGQNDLGGAYEYGWGVTKDIEKAEDWYTKSAEQGNVLGQTNLAALYWKRSTSKKKHNEAIVLWHKAASQGYSDAQRWLGLIYAIGDGDNLKPDDNSAKYWRDKSMR